MTRHKTGGTPPGDYEVGYGKPPRAHQFKPGQPSGNPKGRKRKLSPEAEARAILRRSLDEKVTIRDGSAIRRVSAFEATVEKLRARWLKDGDLKALQEWRSLCTQFGAFEPDEGQDQELAPDFKAILASYAARSAPAHVPVPDEPSSEGSSSAAQALVKAEGSRPPLAAAPKPPAPPPPPPPRPPTPEEEHARSVAHMRRCMEINKTHSADPAL